MAKNGKNRKKMAWAMLSVLLAVLLQSPAGPARESNTDGRPKHSATLYLFWGKGCPHCEKEKEFLKNLKQAYSSLSVIEYEVWYDRKNTELFARIMKSARVQSPGVPATVVGKKIYIGFSQETAKAIADAVRLCSEQGCPDPLEPITKAGTVQTAEQPKRIPFPLLVDLDPATMSLPLFTVIIGALDSFNPCAFFVLLFLLSMLIHAGSRRKMLLLGGIFVFFSGLIYFVFMAAWLNVFLIIGKLSLITGAAGVIALMTGSVNIKDFFFFKKGFSLAIPEKAKPRLFERMRSLVGSSSFPGMIGGTIVLAVTANMYELLCTAGFPLIYTRTLTLHALTRVQYYLYLLLYNLVYIVPLAVIVLIITISLGARKLTEWQGRRLKLVSGLMMLSLGAILLIDPALLNNALASVVLLAGVLLISAITIIMVKKLRPGIAVE